MNKLLFLFCLLLAYGICSVHAQSFIHRNFRTAGADAGVGVARLANGRYVTVGQTESLGNAPLKDVFFQMIEPNGNETAFKRYHLTEIFEAKAVTVAMSGANATNEFFWAGTLKEANNNKIIIGKCDAQANLLWTKIIDQNSNDDEVALNGLYPSNDGGVFIAGWHSTCSGQCNDSYVAKISATGAVVWQKNYPIAPNNDDKALSLTLNPTSANSPLWVCGTLENAAGYLMQINPSDGTLIDVRLFGEGTPQGDLRSITALPDGSLTLLGTTTRNRQGELQLFKVGANGTPAAGFPIYISANSGDLVPYKHLFSRTYNSISILTTLKEGAISKPLIIRMDDRGNLALDPHIMVKAVGDHILTDILEYQTQLIAVGSMMMNVSDGGQNVSWHSIKADFTFNQQTCMLESYTNVARPVSQSLTNRLVTNLQPIDVNINLSDAVLSPVQSNMLAENSCCAVLQPSIDLDRNGICEGMTRRLRVIPNNNPNFVHTVEFINDAEPTANMVMNTTTDTDVIFTKAGTYRVVYSYDDIVNGCTKSLELPPAITVRPGVVITNFPSDTTVCVNQLLRFQPRTNAQNPRWMWVVPNLGSDQNNPNATFNTAFSGQVSAILQVTDVSTGCSVLDTVIIRIIGGETSSIDKRNNLVCKGSSFRLNTLREYAEYAWSPAQFLDNPNIRNPLVHNLTRPTMFYLMTKNIAGCELTDSILLIPRRFRRSPVRDTVLCEGLTTITLSVRPDSNNYTCVNYFWQPNYQVTDNVLNRNTLNIRPDRDTCYIVTATCGTCVVRDTICVKLRKPLNITRPADVTICRGESTRLEVVGGVSYEWTPTAGLSDSRSRRPIASPNVSTTYTLTVTDAYGCRQSFQVNVSVIPLGYNDLPAETTICQGASIRVPAGQILPNLLYFWEPQTGIQAGQELTANPLLAPPVTTTYTVEVIDSETNCSRLDTMTVNVVPKPLAQVVGNTKHCFGKKQILRTIGAQRFFWRNATPPGFYDSLEVSPLADFTYEVIPSSNGCDGDVIFFSVSVTPPPSAVFNVPNQSCLGRPITVTYSGTIRTNETPTWSWDGGVVRVAQGGDPLWGPFEVTYNDLGIKSIRLKVVSDNGCVDSLTRSFMITDAPYVSAGRDLPACFGEEVVMEATLNYGGNLPCTFEWTPATGLNNPNVLRPIARVTQTTTYTLVARCGSCVSPQATMTVFVEDPPVVFTDTHKETICAGGIGVRLNARAENGTPPYFFQWIPADGLDDVRSANPIANPTNTTTYSVIVSDGNGCQSRPAFTQVVVHAIPRLTAGPDQFVCEGTSGGVYLQGRVLEENKSIYTYRWNPSTGLANPNDPNTFANPTVTTIYTLTVRNRITGCASDSTTKDTAATVVVKVNPRPIADAGPDEVFICLNDSIQIGSVATSTGPEYRYLWRPATGLSDSTAPRPFAKPTITTEYVLTVFSNGCPSNADRIKVSVKNFPVFKLETYGHICYGDTYQVKINLNPSKGPFNVKWSPTEYLSDVNSLTPKAFPPKTTVYRCTLTTEGCTESYTDSVIVRVHPRPIIRMNPLGSDLRVCPGGKDSLFMPSIVRMPAPFNADPIYFNWSPKTGVGDTTVLNTSIKPQQTTTYTLTVRTGKCFYQDTVTVFVLPFVLAKINADTNDVCMGDTIKLRGTGGNGAAIFTWHFRERNGQLREWKGDSLTLVPDTSGWLVLTVTEGNCYDEDSLFIIARTKPQVKFTYSRISDCEPFTVRFYTTSKYQADWTWDFGDNTPILNEENPIHTYSLPGKYTVKLTVRSLQFCNQTVTFDSLITVHPIGRASIFSDPPAPVTLYLPNAEVQFRDSSVRAKDYFWEFGDGATSTEKNPKHLYVTPGSYTVRMTMTDSANCRVTQTLGNFEVKDPEIFFPTVFTPNNDGINDVWDVRYFGSERVKISVFDRSGILMHEYIFGEGGWNGKMKNTGDDAASGVYFYLAKVGEKMFRGDFTLIR
jgi:gliding motility-associated-like protein